MKLIKPLLATTCISLALVATKGDRASAQPLLEILNTNNNTSVFGIIEEPRTKPYKLEDLQPIEYIIPERPVVPGNTYFWGQCVWLVKNKRPDVPNSWSNAIYWRDRAKRDGWIVTKDPIPKAIAWSDTYYLGHVAYVESVNPDDTVTISEMNYKGVGVLSHRTVPKSDFTYIY